MKIFLDTNVWLRFFLADEPQQHKDCLELFSQIENGKYRPYISTIVLLEINYILTSTLKIKKAEAFKIFEAIFKIRNLVIMEKTNFPKAFKLYQKTGIKLADCLIASQNPPKAILCTYDQDFLKIPQLTTATPKEIFDSKETA